MSAADDRSGREDPDRPPEPPRLGRHRGRAVIVGVVLGAAALVIAFMVLVSQCGTGDESEIYGRAGNPTTATALVRAAG
jgi:hypothetical protein